MVGPEKLDRILARVATRNESWPTGRATWLESDSRKLALLVNESPPGDPALLRRWWPLMTAEAFRKRLVVAQIPSRD